MPSRSKAEKTVTCVSGDDVQKRPDSVAVEEPVEIRLAYQAPDGELHERAISVTMRTPGDDYALAVGFLFSEGLIGAGGELGGQSVPQGRRDESVVQVELRAGIFPELDGLERHFYTTSSCGVCGKSSIDAVRSVRRHRIDRIRPVVSAAAIHAMPDALRQAQAVFDTTGGLHAAGLFDADGALLRVREDVGRHNAVDKLIGSYLLEDAVPLADRVLFVSGRASFELVQKAAMAGIPVMAAVGAPSSLAVELAVECGITLVGFVRNGRFNIYNGEWRIDLATA